MSPTSFSCYHDLITIVLMMTIASVQAIPHFLFAGQSNMAGHADMIHLNMSMDILFNASTKTEILSDLKQHFYTYNETSKPPTSAERYDYGKLFGRFERPGCFINRYPTRSFKHYVFIVYIANHVRRGSCKGGSCWQSSISSCKLWRRFWSRAYVWPCDGAVIIQIRHLLLRRLQQAVLRLSTTGRKILVHSGMIW